MLRRSPGFAAAAILTLALGIGANATIFSFVNAVLLRPLPYREPGRLVSLWQNNTKQGVADNPVSPANFLDWRERSRSFEGMAAIEPFGMAATGDGEPERFSAFLVTDGFFETMGRNPLRGRWFHREEYEPGRDRVVILGNGLWRRRFGGDPAVVGRTLRLDGRPYTVVGILPAEFQFPADRDVWVPQTVREEDRRERGSTYWQVVARLKPGVSATQAQEEMSAIAATLAREYPDANSGMGATVAPLYEVVTRPVRASLVALFGAVFLLLLIACVNVANLLLARGAERQRELAIRLALGVGRGRLVRQLVVESMVLAALGGAAGFALAEWASNLLRGIPGLEMHRLAEVRLDTPVVLFLSACSLLTVLLFGLAPAAQLARLDWRAGARGEWLGRNSGPARPGLRRALVVAEVALALVLLAGAGMLVRSLSNLLRVDPGFSRDRVLALQIFLGRAYYENPAATNAFYDQTLERVAAVPGVQHAAVVSSPPFLQMEQDVPFTVVGRPAPPTGSAPSAYYTAVSDEYAAAMSIPVRRGRFFTRDDRTTSTPVVVLDEAMARRFFPAEDPIGKRLTVMTGRPVVREVVGVVGDVLHSGLDASPRAEMFVPRSQDPIPEMTFVVKTAGDPGAMTPAIKAAIRQVNPQQTFAKTATMERIVEDSMRQRRLDLFLFVSFAALALALAGIGIYGVVAYVARCRTREIGIRMALGAGAADVIRLVVREGMRPAVAGVSIGLIGALAAARLMRSMLFGLGAADPLTFAAVAGVMLCLALVACWIPARRAARLDPLDSLRSD
jgi:putative ABC transport system permease protein